jgi:hypothetical protein
MNTQRIIKAAGTDLLAVRNTVRVGQREMAEFVPDCDDAPEIKLITEDGVVRRIEVRCTCGKTTTLLCEYGASERSA